jgi:hypothetical protein
VRLLSLSPSPLELESGSMKTIRVLGDEDEVPSAALKWFTTNPGMPDLDL